MNRVGHYGRLAITRYESSRRLARERRLYRCNKRRHLQLYQPDVSRAQTRELMASFIEDGVAVVREFLPKNVVQKIATEVRPSIEAVANSCYGGPLRKLCDEEDGLFRLYEVEESLSPSSRVFFESAFITDLANSMTRTGMHSKDRYLDYKAKVGGRDANVDYHIDHWKLRFKTFLLLQDVSEDQAPLVYVTGSHREERWRQPWDWGYQQRETAGAVLRPDQVDKIRRRYGYEERIFTGQAGDLILANTRGIHRGTILKSGTRLQLVHLFAMNGPPEYAC